MLDYKVEYSVLGTKTTCVESTLLAQRALMKEVVLEQVYNIYNDISTTGLIFRFS